MGLNRCCHKFVPQFLIALPAKAGWAVPESGAGGKATVNSVPSPDWERTEISPRVLLHDAVRYRQAQAGAVLVLFGCEKRVEDVRQDVRRGCRSRCPSPGSGPARRRRRKSVDTSSRPPLGMASPALTISTSTTCWIWLASHCGRRQVLGEVILRGRRSAWPACAAPGARRDALPYSGRWVRGCWAPGGRR